MTNSQAHQDVFALKTCINKSYIEVGGNRPKKWNNTFLLEENGFTGYTIENAIKWQDKWYKSTRTNQIFWDNALTFDYKKALFESNIGLNVGYLSCDIDPAANTFQALKKIIRSGINFDCITFEDDRYNENEPYDLYATNFLKSYGYKVAVSDVYTESNNLFETWFVKEHIDFDSCTYTEWIKENI